MYKNLRIGLAALAIVAICGCGGKSSTTAPSGGNNNNPSDIILTGSVAGEYTTAVFVGAWDHTNNVGGVAAQVTGSTTINIDLGFTGDLTTATYKSTDAGAAGAISVVNTATNLTWTATASTANQAQGSYTMTINSTGTPVTQNGDKAYTGLHGVINATLPALPSSGASGTVTLQATF